MSDTNKNCIENIFDNLQRHLMTSGTIKGMSQEFAALRTNVERVDFAYNLLDVYDLFPAFVDGGKNSEISGKMRQMGNEMFKLKKGLEALELYTKSIALAEYSSENLALGFANRSAVLFEKGFYKECLLDIGRALEYNYPEKLKPKLMKRKERAIELKSMQNYQNYYEPIPEIPEENTNRSIQCASNSVAIEYAEDQGRYIVATKNIEIGEIIAIEKPFCRVLIDQYHIHCHECLQLCYNLIPCKECVVTLYCSEKCRDSAIYYHKYACKVLSVLQLEKLEILPLKIALSTKDEYKTVKENNYNVPSNQYCSDRYKEIHNLVGNTELRSVSDLFRRSTTAAIIFQLIKKYTEFFETLEEEEIFKEILLLHLQTGPCNFHEISEMSEENDFYISKEIGAGAYSFLSMFNHSCSPNVVRHCYGSTIVVRTIESIKVGEQCFDNYGYHYALMPRDERRRLLKKQYFFDCNCKVCINDWPLYRIVLGNTTALIDDENLYKLERGYVETAKKVLRDILSKMREIEKFQPNQEFAALQEILKQCFAIFGNMRRPI